MSYCAFQNTLLALQQCQGIIQNLEDPGEDESLSTEERRAAIELYELMDEMASTMKEEAGVEALESNTVDSVLTEWRERQEANCHEED